MTFGFEGNNGGDDNNDNGDEFTPEEALFLQEEFKPGAYVVLTVYVKLTQLDKFIEQLYESKLDLVISKTNTPSTGIGETDVSSDEEMVGNAPGSKHGYN